MGGGGGGTSTQYVKSETSNLPAYVQPYFTGLLERSQGLLTQKYQPYGQERIAGFTPEQQQVQQQAAGMQTPGQFGTATGLAQASGLGALQMAQYDPAQFYTQRVRSPNVNYFQMGGPESFTQQGAAQQYMSPFVQAALEPQMREAITSAKRGQLAEDLGAARQGTYGGSRQLLASMERERNLGQQMGDIQARGMQTAYEQAQQQFNAEQQARQQAAQQNLQAALQTQQLGTQTGMQAALANQQYNLEAQRAAEQSRQFGAQQGLAGLQQAGQMGQTLANIGTTQQQADLQRLGYQGQTAAQKQALQQQYLDTAYQDFLRQQNYPLEMLQQYSGLLHGVPVQPSTTTTMSAPAPSVASQLLGTGLGALGMYKTLAG